MGRKAVMPLIVVRPEVAAAVAFAGAVAGLGVLRRLASHLPQSLPGPRSLHQSPVPRVGGLSIWAGFLPVAAVGWPALPGPEAIWLIAFLAVMSISLIDDARGVSPMVRMPVHLVAGLSMAIWLVDGGATGTPAGMLAVGAAAILIAWGANLFNFMDGSDGLAAAMAACGFAAYGIAATLAGVDSGLYFALSAAVLPFLRVNLPPARMFMGDVGAVPLGFLAASFGLAGCHAGIWPPWYPLLVFLPFVADATLTLFARLLRRERFWEAHKVHYYQRVNQLGAGHRGTLTVYGFLIAGTAASAMVTLKLQPAAGWLVLMAWGGAIVVLFLGIEYFWQRRTT